MSKTYKNTRCFYGNGEPSNLKEHESVGIMKFPTCGKRKEITTHQPVF